MMERTNKVVSCQVHLVTSETQGYCNCSIILSMTMFTLNKLIVFVVLKQFKTVYQVYIYIYMYVISLLIVLNQEVY